MTLSEIATALGIDQYPHALESVFAEQSKKVNVCDFALLKALEAEYGIFQDYYDAVKAGMEALALDPIRLAWAEAVATYLLDAPFEKCVTIPCIPTDGTPAGDMLYMLVMLPLIPISIQDYLRRGFPEEMVRQMISTCYHSSIQIVIERTGRPGIDGLYFRWLMTYAKSRIFNLAGFCFEVKAFPENAMYLKHNQTGKIAVVLRKGSFHRSGRALGSLAYTDDTDARSTPFTETDESWYGLYAENSLTSQTPAKFLKSEWTCVLKPGDAVLSIHIPRNADLSDVAVDAAFQEGMRIANHHYNDLDIKGLYCSSWLLDPALAELIGNDAKIVRFGNRFIRYPFLSSGREVFTFVFRTSNYDPALLPETTRLERGLKKRYLEGDAIHSFQGVIF